MSTCCCVSAFHNSNLDAARPTCASTHTARLAPAAAGIHLPERLQSSKPWANARRNAQTLSSQAVSGAGGEQRCQVLVVLE